MLKALQRQTLTILVVAATVALSSPTAAQDRPLPTGSICLAPVPEPTRGEKSQANPTGGNPKPDYTVQVDDGDIVRIPVQADVHNTGTLLKGLSLESRHLVARRNKGTVIESFYFRFPEGEPSQCLFMKALYLTWHVWPVERAPWCKCKKPDNNGMHQTKR